MFVAVLCRGTPLSAAKNPRKHKGWAVSSAVERFVYTEDVGGSIPSPPTMFLWKTALAFEALPGFRSGMRVALA
jgi:hypothetical protein